MRNCCLVAVNTFAHLLRVHIGTKANTTTFFFSNALIRNRRQTMRFVEFYVDLSESFEISWLLVISEWHIRLVEYSTEMTALAGHRQYRMYENIRSAHNQHGAVVLDLLQGRMFNLNFVGSRILEILKSKSLTNEIEVATEIQGEFGITAELAAQDVEEFLGILVRYQLIELLVSETAA